VIAAPSKVTSIDTPGGYATNAYTVQQMARIVRDQHIDPMLRRRYRELTLGLDSMDYDAEVAAVWDFVCRNVRYQRDPLGAEHVTLPTELDRQIREDGQAAEDCESIALYAATLFAAGGLKSEFEIQGKDPSRPRAFSHCALRVQNPRTKKWVSFDPIGAYAFPGNFTLGDSLAVPGAPLEHWSLDGDRVDSALGELLGDVESTGSFLGDCFGDAASDLAAAKAIGDPIAKALASAGIYGAIIGGGFEVGTGIAQGIVGTPKSSPTLPPRPGAFPPNGGASSPSSTPSSSSGGKHGGKGGGGVTIPTWGYVVGGLVLAKLMGVL
jgi:hypothetical protein